MKRGVEMGGLVGFVVAVGWVLLSMMIPISPQPVLWAIARFTCPLVPISLAFGFPVAWYWVVASNVASYALIGLIFANLRLLLRHFHPGRRLLA